MMKRVVLLALASLLLGACGGSDNDDPSAATTSDATEETSLESSSANTEDTSSADDAGACPTDAFGERPDAAITGVVTRVADESSGHTQGQWGPGDFTHSKAVNIGEGNWTTYISDNEIGSGTVEAPAGGVVVTMIVWGDGAELTPGLTLPMTFGPIIDNSGNAQANSPNADGEITIIAMTDDRLCFDIDYADDLQEIDGRVSVEL